MRVLFVDDQPVFLDALRSILEGYFDGMDFEGLNSLDEAANLTLNAYDLIIMDLSFRGKDITPNACSLIRANSDVKFLVLTNFEDGRHVRMALEAGAHGYLPKSTPAEILTSVVQMIMAGGRYFPQELAGDYKSIRSSTDRGGNSGDFAPLSLLTIRQIEIFERLAIGATINELAQGLGVSEPTIKADISKATRALNARNRVHAICRALETGLIHPELA